MAGVMERFGAWLLARLPDGVVATLAGAPTEIRGRRLDPRIQMVAKSQAGATPLHELTPAQAREIAGADLAIASGPPLPMERIERRVLPGPAGDIPVRIHHPPGLQGPRPLLLYFHQGGYVIGDLDWCETFCTVLARGARCRVMSVDYRLGPEHRFPAAQEDAFAAVRWARRHAGEVDGDPERLAVAGDSAGGGLAAAICHELRRRGEPQPMLQMLIYPWLVAYADNDAYRDFASSYPLTPAALQWFLSHHLNDDSERDDPRLSPLLEKDFTGLAPAVVATAGFDPLCDEGDAYAKKLDEAGVPVTHRCYESLCHSFTSLRGAVPSAARALDELARDVERAFTRGAP